MALFPLNAKTEILVNGHWNDVSGLVYERDGIQISGGSTQEGDTAQPATCRMTLDNRDGRFSPNYTAGAYYPYLKQAVQLRVSINETSSSGNTYSGYRFWGEVQHWPPQSDVSGEDIFVQIEASGPLRRLQTHGGKGSALTRYYQLLSGSYAPVAYWPCEEDSDTTTLIGAGLSGSTGMTVTGTPIFRSISNFNGSAPIGILNRSVWDGLTGSFGSSGNDVFLTAGTYTWVASTSTVDARAWGAGGGGGNGSGGAGGGGGEFAQEATLAVTVGNAYTITVGAGGDGGPSSGSGFPGDPGQDSFMVGDAVTLRAHGGGGTSGLTGGTGGTGSVNTVHFNGGNGGSNPSNFRSGAGGGGSAGTASAGNNGAAPTGNVTGNGAGGAAVTNGGKGGNGGKGNGSGNPADSGQGGSQPGGGGGGGGDNENGSFNHAGGDGSSGQVQLVYTPQTQATTNVIRFILLVPDHGGNPGKVLIRALTGSSVLARLDVTYVAGGKLRLQGFNGGGTQQFDSGSQSWNVDGRTVMVSIELQNSGSSIAWAFKSVIPGNKTLLGSASGTVTTASVGNVSEIIAGPNADITKTAIGHISLQYAKINLLKVSQALNGHHQEMGIDRFIRLANETAMGAIPSFSETNDHWGFEASTQSWVGTNCALTNPTTTFTPVDTDTQPNLTNYPLWPPDGTHSLLMTANGAGQPTATSPTGTSGKNVLVGDTVSANAEFYAPLTHNNVFIGILWYTGAGAACAHAEDDCPDTVINAGGIATLSVSAVAPATAAFFAIKVGNHNTDANTTQLFCDNVRVHPRMGPQTRKQLADFMKEIHELDAGLMKDAKTLWGLGYRTRISLINQSPALTLDYSKGIISPPLQPVVDDKNTKNDITVKRHKGGKVQVTLQNGAMSVNEPPVGTGRKKHVRRVAAEKDEQLAALANQLLTFNTAADERYPTITINLGRANIVGNAVAPLMSAVASMEIGDYVQITNLPFWYPNTTAKQLIIGYTESINAYEWIVTWNCIPESPFEIVVTSIRRW